MRRGLLLERRRTVPCFASVPLHAIRARQMSALERIRGANDVHPSALPVPPRE
jgi:hypothetical protein